MHFYNDKLEFYSKFKKLKLVEITFWSGNFNNILLFRAEFSFVLGQLSQWLGEDEKQYVAHDVSKTYSKPKAFQELEQEIITVRS